MGVKTEKIEIDLPQDIIFVMRGMEKPGDLKRKMKMALALLLFQEKAISLGKAAELAEVSRVRFMGVLKEHALPSYEYSEQDFERDHDAMVKYREEAVK
ncbi:MAG: hypothetical protein A2Z47_08505 [Thermodesulfovibrio sp. RBG_19FT_COMBO_42_12]|nr:MAG: hypothetical protein A2Z47_08505 [Thermodesulfovibrio sp. RBG_19FT_COMBO_42_12]HZX49179.1 UPF0175 family protein [Nitrospirota bacterium]